MGINSGVPLWAEAEYKGEQHKLVMNFNVDALVKSLLIENSRLERGRGTTGSKT